MLIFWLFQGWRFGSWICSLNIKFLVRRFFCMDFKCCLTNWLPATNLKFVWFFNCSICDYFLWYSNCSSENPIHLQRLHLISTWFLCVSLCFQTICIFLLFSVRKLFSQYAHLNAFTSVLTSSLIFTGMFSLCSFCCEEAVVSLSILNTWPTSSCTFSVIFFVGLLTVS